MQKKKGKIQTVLLKSKMLNDLNVCFVSYDGQNAPVILLLAHLLFFPKHDAFFLDPWKQFIFVCFKKFALSKRILAASYLYVFICLCLFVSPIIRI